MGTALHTFISIFNTAFEVGPQAIPLKKIEIPNIQRDYAQGRVDEEVSRIRTRFLASLHQAMTDKPITLDFVYGDIDENGVMIPLDGQQRLTALFLLHWYAAKQGGIDASEYRFLENFSYETRYSARGISAPGSWRTSQASRDRSRTRLWTRPGSPCRGKRTRPSTPCW
jgi:hypothetical protein